MLGVIRFGKTCPVELLLLLSVAQLDALPPHPSHSRQVWKGQPCRPDGGSAGGPGLEWDGGEKRPP